MRKAARRLLYCAYRGRKRLDIPHAGPCCTPYECSHPKTPRIVQARICRICSKRSMTRKHADPKEDRGLGSPRAPDDREAN